MAGRRALSKHRCRETFSSGLQICNKNGLSRHRHNKQSMRAALRGLVNCAVAGPVVLGTEVRDEA